MEAMILEEMSGAAHSYHDIVRGEAHELMVPPTQPNNERLTLISLTLI